jgi:ketosteroid isomerase-like protein
MTPSNHQIARDFFSALSKGDVPDYLLTTDMQMWTTSTGTWQSRARFQAGIKVLALAFNGGLHYTVESLTSEADRVAAEVISRGLLITGESYETRYLFMLRMRDGRIASVAEHNNPAQVNGKLGPLLQAILTQTAPTT